jgi:hypothetical protein
MNLVNSHKYLLFYVLSFVVLFLPVCSSAQKYGEKDFYLIDSLNLKILSERDKKLIDTSLVKYHDIKEDTSKFEILQHIVDECWDNDVWPRYNHLLIGKS